MTTRMPASSNGRVPRRDRPAKGAILLVAAAFTAAFLLVAVARVLYPYDLDFIEDGILMTALRMADHQPVYVPLQADFVPFGYTPLYPWLGGLLLRVVGPGYVPLRLLSLASALAVCGLLYWIGRRESGQSFPGVVGAGLFLAGYRISGFWYELARVDSLFVALSLAGLTLGVYGSGSWLTQVGAAVALAFAVLTKQTALLLGVGMGAYLLLTARQRAWPFCLTYALLTVVPVALMQRFSDGWFLYYTVHVASLNPVELGRILGFLGFELLGVMGGLSALAILAVVLSYRRSGWRGVRRQPWFVWTGLAIVISGAGRAHVGGDINNRMLAYTLLCLAPALLARALAEPRTSVRPWLASLASGLILVQFAVGVYNPLRYIPTPAMRAAGDRLIADIAAVDGEVMVLMHPYYAWLAGKPPSAQAAALWHARERGSLPVPPDLAARLEHHHYAAVVSDDSLFETESQLQQLLDTYYTPARELSSDRSPATIAGMVVRPRLVYRPRTPDGAPGGVGQGGPDVSQHKDPVQLRAARER